LHTQTRREAGISCLQSRDLCPMSRVPIKKTNAGDPAAFGAHQTANVGDLSTPGEQQARDAADPAAPDVGGGWNEAYPDDEESWDEEYPDEEESWNEPDPAAPGEQQTSNTSNTCDCNPWYDECSQDNRRFFRQIHGAIHSIDEWRRRIRGYVASLKPLLQTTMRVMAMKRADDWRDPIPTPYHTDENSMKTAARHIFAIEDEYFVSVYHFHALRDDYAVFGRELRRVLNDPGFAPQYQRDKLAAILRAGMEKLTVDLHNRFVQARDSLRQAHLGLLGLYDYARTVAGKRGQRYIPDKIDTDMWARQAPSVFMAELPNLRPAMMEEYDFRYHVGRHGDFRLQFWVDQWVAMPEEERRQLYGYRGSGWYRTGITHGFNPDRSRRSEPDWRQSGSAASWGERVFDAVYSRLHDYLANEGRLPRKKYVNVSAMYGSRYSVLATRFAQRTRDDRLTPLCHQLLDEFSTDTDPELSKQIPVEHSRVAEVSLGGTTRLDPKPQPRARQAPRQGPDEPGFERDDWLYQQMGPLFEPVYEDLCIDDFPDTGSTEDNPRVALDFLDSLWEDNWRWHAVTSANQDCATDDFARWGRRASAPLETIPQQSAARFQLESD